MHNDNKSEEEISLLMADLSPVEAEIFISLLESYGIPVMKKSKGSGGIMEIYTGVNNYGIDLYVPAKALEEASEIIENSKVE